MKDEKHDRETDNPLPDGWECSNPTLCIYDHSYLEPADFSGASDEVGFANDR